MHIGKHTSNPAESSYTSFGIFLMDLAQQNIGRKGHPTSNHVFYMGLVYKAMIRRMTKDHQTILFQGELPNDSRFSKRRGNP